ncbi:MAG: mechanosensitive ion channel family protein, partial [Planctomycetota bacterium]
FPLWLQQQFSESLWGTTFFIKDYQWICLIALLLIGFLAGQLARILFDYLTKLWFRMTSTDVDDQIRKQLWAPVIALVHILIWYYGTTMIDLPSSAMGVILPVLKFFTVLAAVWTAFRAINLLQNYLMKKAKTTASRYDDSLVPFICSALKLVAVILGVVLFVDVFEKDWKAVIGGFGVVGIAVAIAAKDMLGNIFGSVTVLSDRPFDIGDWVVIDGKVEGTVEHVGIRSSRLRTFHNSQIIVPNSLLTTANVDNMGRRQYRRFKTMLQIRYDTPVDKIESFCAGVRQLIHDNPYAKGENAHVFVNQFSESSIDILLYVFLDCSTWSVELRERHCLLTSILRLAEHLNVGFAFPTRTLAMEKTDDKPKLTEDGDSTPGDLGRQAAAAVQRRDDGQT